MSGQFRHQTSIVLNVVLAFTIVILALRRSEPAPTSPAIEVPATMPNDTPVSIKHQKLPRYTDAASASDQRRWLVDQLRAMGVPDKILAQVAQLNLEEGWQEHAKEVSEKCNGDPATMAALQLEFDMSKDAEMRAALGDEGFKQWDHENMMREANAGNIPLTPSETDAVYDLWKKVQQRELELKQARLKGEMDNAEADDAWDKAVSEYNRQMKALLGEERYAKAQQTDRESAAASLRQEMAKANPSDSQFQLILQAQQLWNERRAELDKQFQSEGEQSSSAYEDQVRALDEARDQEYRRVLGTNVFDTLQKEQDPGYSRMRKYANVWGLDDRKIDYVYGTLKYYEKSVADYRAQAHALEAQGQSVDWDAVNKNLQQFAEQTQQALQDHLGKDSFDKLQRNSVFQFDQTQLPYGRPF
jgi:hypothetical protein